MDQSNKPENATDTILVKDVILEKHVSDLVKKNVDNELKHIKDSTTFALKILGFSLFILFSLFTLFGVRTLFDIEKYVESYVSEKVDDLVLDKDSNVGVKKQLNNLLNEATLHTNLIKTGSKNDIDEVLNLNVNEWERLKNWLKEPDESLQNFSDILFVLNNQENKRKRIDANSLISKLLVPPEDSSFSWMDNDPEKKNKILDIFVSKDLGRVALELVKSEKKVSNNLKIKALRYLRQPEVFYEEAFHELVIHISDIKNNGREIDALLAELILTAITLKPANSSSIEIVNNILEEDEFTQKTNLIARLLNSYINVNIDSQRNHLTENDLQILAAQKYKLLKGFVKNKGKITIGNTRVETMNDFLKDRLNVERFYFDVPYYRAQVLEEVGDLELLWNLAEYWNLLNEHISNDFTFFSMAMITHRAFFPIRSTSFDNKTYEYNNKLYSIVISFDENSVFKTIDSNGKEVIISGKDVEEINLSVKKRFIDEVKIVWIGTDDVEHISTLTGVEGKVKIVPEQVLIRSEQ